MLAAKHGYLCNLLQFAPSADAATAACSQALMGLAGKADGLSGRTLRKLPLLAWQRNHSRRGTAHSCVEFVALLDAGLEAELADRLSCSASIS